MNEKLKKMEKREDGFLEVQIKRLNDFDEYLFQKMHEDTSCLLCIRDHRSRSRLYYDLKGYVTLAQYLEYRLFEKGELLAFLIFIMEDLVRVNSGKPVYLDIEYIFLSADGHHLRFLVLPLQEDGWVFQKESAKTFLIHIVKTIHASEEYETLGLLVQLLKQEEFTLPLLLQRLHAVQESNKKKLNWWQRFLRKGEEPPYYVRDMPALTSYPEMLPYLDVQESAVVYEEKGKPEVDTFHKEKKSSTRKHKEPVQKKRKDIGQRKGIEDSDKKINDENQFNIDLSKGTPSQKQATNPQGRTSSKKQPTKPQVVSNHQDETMLLFAQDCPYLEGLEHHEIVTLNHDPFTIGRSPDNDLCLEALQVSGYHAAIHLSQSMLQDLHSSNGTRINAQTIHQQELKDNDEIWFANCGFRYHGGKGG